MILLEFMKIIGKTNIDYSKDTIKISDITFLKSYNKDYLYRILDINDVLYKIGIEKDHISIVEYYSPYECVLQVSFDDLNDDESYLILKYGRILLEFYIKL